MKKDLTKIKNIPKTINNLAFHNSIGFMSLVLLSVIDTLFLSHYSKDALAASIIGAPIFYMVISTFIGVSIAKQIFISKQLLNEKANVQKLSKNITWISELVLISVLFILYLCLPKILSTLITEKHLIDVTYKFIVIHLLGLPFCIYNIFQQSYLRSIGNTKLPSLGMTLIMVLNGVLDPIFIFYFNLGAEGAAIATVIAWVLTSVFFAIVKSKEEKNDRKNEQNYSEFVTLIPSMVLNQLTNTVTTLITIFFVNKYAVDIVSSYGVTQRLEKILVVIMLSFGSALSICVGQNYRNKDLSKKIFTYTRKRTIYVVFAFGIILLCLKDVISLVFDLNSIEEKLVIYNLIILSMSGIVQSIFIISINYLNVLNYHKNVMKLNIFKNFILLPIILCITTQIFNEYGIYLGLLINHIISIFLINHILRLTKEENLDIVLERN